MDLSVHDEILRLRASLPRTWDALIAPHGSPNEVQRAAIPPILAGRDVLLGAPTASGKTEAYVAPLVERHVPASEGEAPCRLLIVSPTRALVNDLHRRLQGPLRAMGVDCGRWTGDHHDQGRLHPVTFLTPEGLDSRLSRARRALGGLRAVVLDELHVMDDTSRGDQLRVLLGRLRHSGPVQVVAASATIEDPAAVAARYLLDASLVMVGQRRRILARIAIADGPTQVEREFERMVDRGFRKILAFARSREEVEAYVKALQGRPPFGSDVLAHHGSLGRAERLRVEHQFLTRPAALCFATTTLELGIDIGDIDLIAVLGAPFAVTSLIQQAGRGGRRASRNPLLALARDPFDASVFRVMLEAAAEGRLLEPSPLFRAGVLVQQALSILHENPGRWVSPAALRARLPDDLRTEWDEKRLGCLLDHMTRRNWLERGGERYSLGERGERMWSRVLLHSNLRERGGVLVRDSMTGDEVGRIAVAESQSLSLGGKARQVLLRDGGAVVTRSFGGGDLPIFADGALPLVSRELARRILEEVGIPVPSRSHIDGVVLFHGLGSAASLLLGKVMELAGAGVRRSGPLAVVVDSLPFDWPSPEMANKAVSRSHAQLARSLSLGSFHHELPVDEQRRLVTQAVHLDEVRAFLERGPPPPVEHDDEEDAAWW